MNKQSPGSDLPLLYRARLFGELSVDELATARTDDVCPWNSFATARQHLASGNARKAIGDWTEIISTPGLTSRSYLQAWSFLRRHGESSPAESALLLLGVVFEIALPEGIDALAAYRDESAVYVNFSGSGIVWERRDDDVGKLIRTLLGSCIQIGPLLEGPYPKRQERPTANHMSISLLTPSGVYFGQTGAGDVAAHDIKRQLLPLATALMRALIAKQRAG